RSIGRATRVPMAAPATTAAQSNGEKPDRKAAWPTSTLTIPTATAHTKASAPARSNDMCCQSALASKNASAAQATPRAKADRPPRPDAATTTTAKATAMPQRPTTTAFLALEGVGEVA